MVKTKGISIKRIIILIFILAMILSHGGTGYLIFRSWFLSAKKTAKDIAEGLNKDIYNQIHSFMHRPYHINQVNQQIIENGILDLSHEEPRNKFFVGVLESHDDEIYSFSYGSITGEYYGARRNEKGIIEIMKNNAETGGHSWYYSVKEDKTAGALAVDAGKFDPRTREWYKIAAGSGEPSFSPLYKHFVMDDLTISAAWPIFNTEGELRGVLGTHMLLGNINTYLEEIVEEYDGYALVFEKDTNYLIANSMGHNNFTLLKDDSVKRLAIQDMDNPELEEAYEHYKTDTNTQFFCKDGEERLCINVKEIKIQGVEWVVITALPESIFVDPVVKNIYLTLLILVIFLIILFVIFNIIIVKFMKPVDKLLEVSETFASGDLSQRVPILRNDEIGRISLSFNEVANGLQVLINSLEDRVEERTAELHQANETLAENKNQLQLILDTTAEAIYGVNLDMKCIFCNNSSLKLLGYSKEEELLGKNMHQQIHHSFYDGKSFPLEECRIYQSIKQNRGYIVDDEVFWRADGTSFSVEYRSYPQIKDGQVIGAVITFTDITERKRRDEEIRYLNYHDPLTGLYNRRFFEEYQTGVNAPENLPLSIIFGDINGLKMTNDIFGHKAGDRLIQKAARILLRSCRTGDMVARVGGDEFVILLPNTNKDDVKLVLARIRSGFEDARVEAIKCSISLGSATKTRENESLEEIINKAEHKMYRDKTINRQSVNKDIIHTIMDALHQKSPREREHSINVGRLCVKLGKALYMAEPEISRLEKAGYLHDIGKIVLDEAILGKSELNKTEEDKMRQHPVMGYRILNLCDDTLDLAEYIYGHHERWDGGGYPRNLKGEQIPLISRIISIVETYERRLNRTSIPFSQRKNLALNVVKEEAGTRFDPHIAKVFIDMVEKD